MDDDGEKKNMSSLSVFPLGCATIWRGRPSSRWCDSVVESANWGKHFINKKGVLLLFNWNNWNLLTNSIHSFVGIDTLFNISISIPAV